MNIAQIFSGGNPRSLGRTEEVVSYVLAHQDKLKELFECLFSHDEIVRMRAGDALEKICRVRPDWLKLYADQLLTEVAVIDQASVQWHLAQMIGELDLSEAQHRRAVEILKHNLEQATDWIVLNYSLEVFAQFAKADEDLKPYFAAQLRRHEHSPHKSVAKRAAKLRASLKL